MSKKFPLLLTAMLTLVGCATETGGTSLKDADPMEKAERAALDQGISPAEVSFYRDLFVEDPTEVVDYVLTGRQQGGGECMISVARRGLPAASPGSWSSLSYFAIEDGEAGRPVDIDFVGSRATYSYSATGNVAKLSRTMKISGSPITRTQSIQLTFADGQRGVENLIEAAFTGENISGTDTVARCVRLAPADVR